MNKNVIYFYVLIGNYYCKLLMGHLLFQDKYFFKILARVFKVFFK